jgi:hypothetical protein
MPKQLIGSIDQVDFPVKSLTYRPVDRRNSDETENAGTLPARFIFLFSVTTNGAASHINTGKLEGSAFRLPKISFQQMARIFLDFICRSRFQ